MRKRSQSAWSETKKEGKKLKVKDDKSLSFAILLWDSAEDDQRNQTQQKTQPKIIKNNKNRNFIGTEITPKSLNAICWSPELKERTSCPYWNIQEIIKLQHVCNKLQQQEVARKISEEKWDECWEDEEWSGSWCWQHTWMGEMTGLFLAELFNKILEDKCPGVHFEEQRKCAEKKGWIESPMKPSE